MKMFDTMCKKIVTPIKVLFAKYNQAKAKKVAYKANCIVNDEFNRRM